jgi:acyl carrier protein
MTVSMDDLITVLGEEIPAYSPERSNVSFADLEVDSFDLLALRTRVEQCLGHEISDADWVQIKTPDGMFGLLNSGGCDASVCSSNSSAGALIASLPTHKSRWHA